MRFANFLGGFFTDQKGSTSSKRLITYSACFLLFLLVKGSLDQKIIDINVLLVVAGIILFGIGAVTSEFFAKIDKQ